MCVPLRVAGLTAVLCVSASATAFAQTTIGASTNNAVLPCAGGACGQSFTVPAAPSLDNVLQSFTLTFATSSDQTFQVYAFSGGVLSGSPLFTQAVSPTSGTETRTFTPAGGLALVSGAQYAAVLTALGTGVSLSYGFPGGYAGGDLIECPASVCSVLPTADATFSATFVSAQATVPEPSTWTMLAAGLLGLGALAVLQKRKS
jgi:hypothetical protein